MTDRTRLASFSPTKLGETELQQVAEAMHTRMQNLRVKYPTKLGRRDAIRRHCIDCCGGTLSEVRLCEDIPCALWAYRMGGDPFRGRSK